MMREARARLPALQARLDALVAVVKAAIDDDGRLVEAGRALDEIVATKLYAVAGHRSLSGLLDEIGISRSTAHNWRVLARRGAADLEGGRVAAYARARPRRSRAPRAGGTLPRGAQKRARDLAAALRAKGVDAVVRPVLRRGELRFRFELPAAAADRLARPR